MAGLSGHNALSRSPGAGGPSGARRPLFVAATARLRMGDAIGDEIPSETRASFAARAPAARRDDHSQTTGAGGVRAIGRAWIPPAAAAVSTMHPGHVASH
jgi:hypothetical protein